MNFTKKLALVLVFVFVLFAFAVIGNATEEEAAPPPSEGYVYNSKNQETNIKWTVTQDSEGQNICTFEIDASATDKVPATVVTGYSAEGKKVGYGNNKEIPWYYDGKIHKMIFKEGITGVDGGVYMVISSIKTVEVSKDFVTIGYASFECNASFNTFMVTGTEYKAGLCDLTYLKTLGSYCFDGDKFTEVILGENIKDIPTECFKGNKFREVNFPANITSVSGKAFHGNGSLKKITVNNPNMKISDTAFDNCVQFFTIVGYKGSTAETFAENGGYEFVDIETGEVLIKGTRVIEKDPAEIIAQYPREEADASDLLEHMYNGSRIVNTYWAYFKDSKTLVFTNNGSGYNETGNQTSASVGGKKYSEYKFEVEHIIIGTGIHKISNRAFEGFSALKTVQYGGNIQQIDNNAFNNCKSLSSICILGKDLVEGVADLSKISQCDAGIIKNTSIETVKLNAKVTADKINPLAFLGCKNIVAKVDEAMITFAKDNFFNVINMENPEEIHEHYMYINPESVACGSKAIASFDEETGTLTLLGEGALNDIVNYYGGGSKKQPWFSYRKDIKKVVVGPKITYIGKYIFCQCVNLQEIELSGNPIEIGAGAFEKCYSLRSIYVTGNEPILGTFDLRTVPNLEAWTFAYNYLVVNPIIGETSNEIGTSVFEDCMNIAAVYGTPGTNAEAFATTLGVEFKDASVETPAGKLATPPEMNQDEKERAERDKDKDKDEETEPAETEPTKYCIVISNPPEGYAQESVAYETEIVETIVRGESEMNITLIIIIAAAAAVAVAAAVVVIIVAKKRKEKKS
ncbi:MAG: leucine-rich repeat protein [Clostridia bacterium]|nr:leucine-rich repeat protein [Clostridia bacterium]